MSEETKQPADEQVLFPDISVEVVDMNGKTNEVKVKPWSFGKLMEVNPLLEDILIGLQERGTEIDLNEFTLKTITNIYFSATPQIAKIITKTTELTEEQVENLSIEGAVKLAMAIFETNKGPISSFFGLFFGKEVGSLEATEEEENQ